MPSRQDHYNVFAFLISAGLYLMFYFSTYTHYFEESNSIPPPLVIPLTAGLGVGIIIGAAIETTILRSIGQKGEYKPTYRILICIILGLVVPALVDLYFFSLSRALGYTILNFLWFSLVATCGTFLVLTIFWELKHKKLIMGDSKSNKTYAVSKNRKNPHHE